MPTPTECADFFEAALKRYCEISTVPKVHDSCDLQDLLTDAMHYCKHYGITFDNVLVLAKDRFSEENKESFIRLNDTEHVRKADCGCYLEIMPNGDPAFFMCDDHTNGFECYQRQFKIINRGI